jgi:uncharacterized membrane protein
VAALERLHDAAAAEEVAAVLRDTGVHCRAEADAAAQVLWNRIAEVRLLWLATPVVRRNQVMMVGVVVVVIRMVELRLWLLPLLLLLLLLGLRLEQRRRRRREQGRRRGSRNLALERLIRLARGGTTRRNGERRLRLRLQLPP